MDKKVKELRELIRLQEELTAEIEAIKDSIKAVMADQDTDELRGADYRITWKEVKSSRLDTRALKKELPDVASRYMKESTCRRFLIA